MRIKGEVVYVVIDDEGKLQGVYADKHSADVASAAVCGEIHVILVQ